MKKQWMVSAFAVFAALFFACRNDMLLDDKKTVVGKSWAYPDSLRFDFDLADTSHFYNLFVDVEHADDYPFENLYVKIHTILPSGKRLSKTRSLQLAAPSGEWLGSGSGEKITARLVLQEHALFREPGHYALVFEQWMRQDSLTGISAIGLAVQRTNEKRGDKPK